MKKIILSMLILVLSLSLFFGVVTVYAEGSTSSSTESSTDNATELDMTKYHKINDNITFTYMNSDNPIDVKLPTNYYVEYISSSSLGVKVKYNNAFFFVSDDDFSNMIAYNEKWEYKDPQYKAANPLHISLGVEDETRVIFSKPDYTKNDKVLSISDTTKELIFLNNVSNSKGDMMYLVYVPSTSNVGYIKAAYTDNPTLSVPVWTDPALKPETKPETPDDNPDVNPDDGEVILPDTGIGESDSVIKPNEDNEVLPSKNNVVKIVLIVSICVLAAVLVFLIFKPTRQKRGRYSVDDDDDYDRDDSYNDRY